MGRLLAGPAQVPKRPARTDLRQAERRARPDLAPGRLPRRQAVPLRRRHVRQQLHQYFPLRRRDRDPIGFDHAVGQRPLSHRAEVATGQTRWRVHLARRQRRRRLPGGRVRARTPTASDPARSGWTTHGNIWMAYGFFRYDFQGLDDRGNPIYRADKVTVLDPPEGMRTVARVWYDADRDLLVAAERGERHAAHRPRVRLQRLPGRQPQDRVVRAGGRTGGRLRDGGGRLRLHGRLERAGQGLGQPPVRRRRGRRARSGPDRSAASRTPAGSTSSPGSRRTAGRTAST